MVAVGLPCRRNCGCLTDRMIDDGSGQKVPLCVWCEDGVPCEAAKQKESQPVRALAGAERTVTVKVSKEDAAKYPKKARPFIEPAMRKVAPKVAKKLRATVQDAIDDMAEEERETMSKTGKEDPLKGHIEIAEALKLFGEGMSVMEIAEKKGFPAWRFYQSDAWKEAVAELKRNTQAKTRSNGSLRTPRTSRQPKQDVRTRKLPVEFIAMRELFEQRIAELQKGLAALEVVCAIYRQDTKPI
jgi:hypothetical protein